MLIYATDDTPVMEHRATLDDLLIRPIGRDALAEAALLRSLGG